MRKNPLTSPRSSSILVSVEESKRKDETVNIIKNLLTANTFRPVWWSTFETVSEFGGYPNITKAISDADHNIKVAANILRKTNRNDLDALEISLSNLEQAKFNREILDGIYDDTENRY